MEESNIYSWSQHRQKVDSLSHAKMKDIGDREDASKKPKKKYLSIKKMNANDDVENENQREEKINLLTDNFMSTSIGTFLFSSLFFLCKLEALTEVI